MVLAGLLAAGAFAQSSLFHRYDVNMNKWAQLPDNLPWRRHDVVLKKRETVIKGRLAIPIRLSVYGENRAESIGV